VGESEEGMTTNTSLPVASQQLAENPNTTVQEERATTVTTTSSPDPAQASLPS